MNLSFALVAHVLTLQLCSYYTNFFQTTKGLSYDDYEHIPISGLSCRYDGKSVSLYANHCLTLHVTACSLILGIYQVVLWIPFNSAKFQGN